MEPQKRTEAMVELYELFIDKLNEAYDKPTKKDAQDFSVVFMSVLVEAYIENTGLPRHITISEMIGSLNYLLGLKAVTIKNQESKH